eukprot:GILK01015582.1.p1 GENE.GILK01015582.1~~GILK01015582.1.p1  ORF type:complete len:205 (+),score=3.05 GILK01015582.1:161-775(+)
MRQPEERSTSKRWCHHCRSKKVGVQCCNTEAGKARSRRCRKVYCYRCLHKYYDVHAQELENNRKWVCPTCLDLCVCTHCTSKAYRKLVENRNVKEQEDRECTEHAILERLHQVQVSLSQVVDLTHTKTLEATPAWRFCEELASHCLTMLNGCVSTTTSALSPDQSSLSVSCAEATQPQVKELPPPGRRSPPKGIPVYSLINPAN